MHIKVSKSNLDKLEQIFVELSYTIRYERGTFNAGYCIVEDKRVVVINKYYDTEARINVLLDILSTLLVMEDSLSKSSLVFYKYILKKEIENAEA